MKEILLCKYGEIVLKGANRKYFEDTLCKELKRKARIHGNFDIYRAQSTIYIEPKDEFVDFEGMFESACKVFGITSVCRCAISEKTVDLNVDGDIYPMHNPVIENIPKAINLILPKAEEI